jgi:hypothetical protein
MRRTNIYLGDAQSSALDELAHAQGLSRAELIRQLIDRGIGSQGVGDLEEDLAAIRDSFGVLSGEDFSFVRDADERSRHLDRVAGDSRR